MYEAEIITAKLTNFFYVHHTVLTVSHTVSNSWNLWDVLPNEGNSQCNLHNNCRPPLRMRNDAIP